MSAPLDVILNDRVLFRPLTGVGNYLRQLIEALRTETSAVTVHPFLSGFLPMWRLPLSTRAGRSWWFRRLLQRAYATMFRCAARNHQV